METFINTHRYIPMSMGNSNSAVHDDFQHGSAAKAFFVIWHTSLA